MGIFGAIFENGGGKSVLKRMGGRGKEIEEAENAKGARKGHQKRTPPTEASLLLLCLRSFDFGLCPSLRMTVEGVEARRLTSGVCRYLSEPNAHLVPRRAAVLGGGDTLVDKAEPGIVVELGLLAGQDQSFPALRDLLAALSDGGLQK